MKCPVCHHKHNEFNHDTLTLEHTETEDFKWIEGTFMTRIDSFSHPRQVTLVACPKCNTVILDDGY